LGFSGSARGLNGCCGSWSGIPDWEPTSETLQDETDNEQRKPPLHVPALLLFMGLELWIWDKPSASVETPSVTNVDGRGAVKYSHHFVCNKESANDVTGKANGCDDGRKIGDHDD
jgi:hypothetical protein